MGFGQFWTQEQMLGSQRTHFKTGSNEEKLFLIDYWYVAVPITWDEFSLALIKTMQICLAKYNISSIYRFQSFSARRTVPQKLTTVLATCASEHGKIHQI